MMRGTVPLDCLVDGRLPSRLPACVRRRRDRFDGAMRDVVELSVPPQYAAEIALRLAKLLLPRHYCHIQDDTHMYVIFPRVVAIVYRDDPASIATAQELGARFDIPPRRMLFETMFGGGAGHE